MRPIFNIVARSGAWIAALSICLAIPVQVQASCIRQSLMNHDYCGPEGSRVTYLVPERVVGNFKRACAGHDACYAFGGEEVVAQMERRFQQSMLAANAEQKRVFRSEMQKIKSSCDQRFYSAMKSSCSQVLITKRPECLTAATGYYLAVSKFADRAFDQALNEAFTCRTR